MKIDFNINTKKTKEMKLILDSYNSNENDRPKISVKLPQRYNDLVSYKYIFLKRKEKMF